MHSDLAYLLGLALLSLPGRAPARLEGAVVNIPFRMAQPILEALGDDLPADLENRSPAELEAAWPDWVTQHAREVSARVTRGEEDTLVNFLTFGTSFTTRPRLAAVEFARLPFDHLPAQVSADTPSETALFLERVDDLLRGLANPTNNERLLFLAQFMEKQGYRPREAYGAHPDLRERDRLKAYMLANSARVVKEQISFQRELEQASQLQDRTDDFVERSRLYRSRGLSCDTSLLPNLAIEESLKAIKVRGLLAPGSVRRAAVIGPGLDFIDKAAGYDFYPQQTIQCFALADTLFRLGLARPGQLKLTSFDVSPRVNDHLRRARLRAQLGDAYVVQLPRQLQVPWKPRTSDYWRNFGDQIGAPEAPIRAPVLLGDVETRAVRIRSCVVSLITPVELDIVTQHVDLPPQEDFDLIVATNIFVYYGLFEQLLAVANTQSMLRAGGLLLSNNSLPLMTASKMRSLDYLALQYSALPGDGDIVVWYQRSPE
jgi:hypothetical protein